MDDGDDTRKSPEHADRALLRRIGAGDQAAFWELWDCHKAALFRLCLNRCGGDRDRANDALSDTLVRAWDGLREHSLAVLAPAVWLHRVAANVCADLWRRKARETPIGSGGDDSMHTTDGRDDPADATVSRDRQAEMLRKIDRLPPHLRDPFVMRVLREMSYQEICDQLLLTPTAARRRVGDARKLLDDESDTDASLPLISGRIVESRSVQIRLPSGLSIGYQLMLDTRLPHRPVRIETLCVRPTRDRSRPVVSRLMGTLRARVDSGGTIHRSGKGLRACLGEYAPAAR